MTRGLSLRSRLVAGMTIVAAVLIAVCIALTVTIQTQLTAQVDDRLRSLALSGPGRGQTPPPRADDAAGPPAMTTDPYPQRISDVYQGLITADGELVTLFAPNFAAAEYPVPDIDATSLDVEQPTTFTVSSVDGAVTYRVLAQPSGDRISVTGLPIDDVIATINRLIWLGVAGSLAILIVLAVVAWWVVRLGIRPVKKMTETATQIAAGDLGVRVPELAPGTESGELAVALNQMLARIETALDERARSEDRLRRFVADASHELRTPVTSIRGYAELYRVGGLADPDELTDAMRRTEQEAARMGRLVNDMLTLARLDEQRPLARRPVDLSELVRDAAADARAAAPARAITVDAEAPNIVIGDDDHLRQVVANVVGNALVHTDGPVHLRSHHDAGRAVVEVSDEGDGIPPEMVEHVTERFVRADPSRSRQRGGSGLGLAIVDAAVSAHGGTVEIRSTPGAGTTVRLDLPAAAADDLRDPAS